MEFDDEVCYCYHVSLRKLANFACRTQPKHASQMSECLGAGTGCGWCIPFLQQIAWAAGSAEPVQIQMDKTEYAAARAAYRRNPERRNRFDEPGDEAGAAAVESE